MSTANGERKSLVNLQVPKLKNVVVREVRDQESNILGRIFQPHDGTEVGVIAAAQAATDRMYAEFATPSNGESRICATDATGNPRWVVAPNFHSMAEVGTEEARYIWCGPVFEPSYPLCSQKCTGTQDGNSVL